MQLAPLNASLLALIAVLAACAGTRPETSAKPGINESFLDPSLDVDSFIERFEGESREVYALRFEIVGALGIEPGDTVADVGAGTGAFLAALAQSVGPTGTVYATDISQPFVDRLADRAAAGGYPWVQARLSGERSADLPSGSADLVFLCDVYHHFEYPRTMMHSIAKALAPGGEVVIVDFERIPGISTEWTLNHVRAGKDEVFAEMDSFGYELVEEISRLPLEENWIARFRLRAK